MPDQPSHDRAIECRVCGAAALRSLIRVGDVDYWRCDACDATLMDAARLPNPETERSRYAFHENLPGDPGYRAFLSKLAVPMLARLPPRREGLDYGCGTGPALAALLTAAGHTVRLYDPFFHPDAPALDRTYDFITCTEVAEHFHHPARDFARLARMLRPSGLLGIMTCFQTDDDRFAGWSYRRDDTHVAFYRESTFRHLAETHGWECEIPARNIVFMRPRRQTERQPQEAKL